MKKKLFAAALLVLMISIIGYGTYAYYTVEGTATNVITSGGVDINLEENFPADGVFDVLPGLKYTKEVWVENTGHDPAWIRVSVDTIVTLADGSVGSPNGISMNFNTKDWDDLKDGYWYYRHPLAPGEKTEMLFTTVFFAPEMGNEYQGSTAHVNVSAYATQVANNGDRAANAKGWPEKTEEVN